MNTELQAKEADQEKAPVVSRGNPTAGERALPSGEGALPGGERALPSGERPFPSREGAFPGGEGTLPSGEGAFPGGERALPTRERAFPVGEKPLPARESPLPARESLSPASPGDHPEPVKLEILFTVGGLASDEVREIVRHLLTGCPRCVAIARRFFEPREKDRGGAA